MKNVGSVKGIHVPFPMPNQQNQKMHAHGPAEECSECKTVYGIQNITTWMRQKKSFLPWKSVAFSWEEFLHTFS
jgi:hypothetical protein